MNKISIFALSTVMAALVIAGPLASQNIVVTPRSETSFVQDVSRDLNAQLDRTHFDWRWDATGITKVRFEAGADGRPVKIRIYEGSGNRALDATARRVVSGLTSLAPLPDPSVEGQLIQANIIVASSRDEMKRLSRRLARSEAARIAASPRERAVLALTLAPRPFS